MIDTIVALWLSQPEWLRTTLISIGQILAVTITVILCVAYTTLAERKVIGYMQAVSYTHLTLPTSDLV